MPGHVTWDPGKALELAQAWRAIRGSTDNLLRPLLFSSRDLDHSTEEERFTAIGASLIGELLVVAYAIRNDEAWIISARRAERAERRRYMEGERIRDDAVEAETIPTVDFSNAVRGRHHIPPRGSITVEIGRSWRSSSVTPRR